MSFHTDIVYRGLRRGVLVWGESEDFSNRKLGTEGGSQSILKSCTHWADMADWCVVRGTVYSVLCSPYIDE